MENLLTAGLELVRTTQTIASPALTTVMRFLSLLGSEWFFLAALPLLYWCVDRRRGARIGLVFLFSAFVNLWAKGLLRQPRPYEWDPSVGMGREETYGFPSGHSQNSAAFWGLSSPLIKKPWGLVLALGFPLLIGFSRIYLGLHFPTDVLGGWALGAFFVVFERLYGDRIERAMDRVNIRLKVACIAALSFGMNALHRQDVSLSGVFFGAGLGFVFAGERLPFSAAGSFGQKLGRYLLGSAGLVVLYILPKLVLPGEGSEFYDLARFVRYGLLGLWVSLGAPWLFLRLGMVQAEEKA